MHYSLKQSQCATESKLFPVDSESGYLLDPNPFFVFVNSCIFCMWSKVCGHQNIAVLPQKLVKPCLETFFF